MVVVGPYGSKPEPSRPTNEQPLLTMLLHRVGMIAVWGAIFVSAMSAMNSSQPLGLILFAFAIIGALLLVRSKQRDASRNMLARWLLRIGIVGAALLPPLAFFNPVIPFALAGWALTGVYWAALIAGEWRFLSGFMRSLSVLFGLGLVIAIVLVTVPGAAAMTGEDKKHWTVNLAVTDKDSMPLSNALVDCVTVDFWNRNSTGLVEAQMARVTDEHGQAEFEFTGTRWLKAVVCGARRAAQDFRPNLPLKKTIIPAPFSYLNVSAYITLEPAPADASAEVPPAEPEVETQAEPPAAQEGDSESAAQDSAPQQDLASQADAERQAFLEAQQRQFQADAERQAFLDAQRRQFQEQAQQPNPP